MNARVKAKNSTQFNFLLHLFSIYFHTLHIFTLQGVFVMFKIMPYQCADKCKIKGIHVDVLMSQCTKANKKIVANLKC